jgi:hypothetical protein
VKKLKKYVPFFEEVYLKDLIGDAAVSNFTLFFQRERAKLMGKEPKLTKYVDTIINKDKNYVDMQFLVTPTEKKYPPNYKYKQVNPNTHALEDNPSKLYEFIVRVEDFFSYLETTPNEITNKDIEDVIKVAPLLVWDGNPSYQYQGINYNLGVLGGSLYPTKIAPTVWKDRGQDGFLGKHGQRIFNSIFFYIPQIRQTIKKKLGLTK